MALPSKYNHFLTSPLLSDWYKLLLYLTWITAVASSVVSLFITLELVVNTATRIFLWKKRWDYISPLLKTIQELSILFQIKSRVLIVASTTVHNMTLYSLSDLVSFCSHTCRLHFSHTCFFVVFKHFRHISCFRTWLFSLPGTFFLYIAAWLIITSFQVSAHYHLLYEGCPDHPIWNCTIFLWPLFFSVLFFCIALISNIEYILLILSWYLIFLFTSTTRVFFF